MPDSVDVVVGLDAGTTSSKFVAVDRSGQVVANAGSDAIPTSAPSPGASVQRPDDIWDALATACRRGIDALAPSTNVCAVAMAAQSGSVIAVVDGVATQAITWMDTRSRSLVDAWDVSTVRSARSLSGWMPSPGLGLSTISWLRGSRDEPDAYDRWASVDDFLMHKLTDQWLTNPSNAAGMQLIDVSSKQWSDGLCDIAGVDPALLSEIRKSGNHAAPITAEAAAATGLPNSTSIVVGGHDQACAALGLGVVTPGSALLSMGTAWVLTMVTDRPELNTLPPTFNLSPHVGSQRWSISQNLGGLGAAIAHAIAEVNVGDAELDPLLKSLPVSRDDTFFLPSIHAADRTGWGEFSFAAAAINPVNRLRAVLEACAFEARKSVEEASPAVPLQELTVIGGGTKSTYLVQCIADAVGVTLTVRPEASWPAMGAAMLAAQACDWPAETETSGPTTIVEPRLESNEISEPRYHEYRRLTNGAPA